MAPMQIGIYTFAEMTPDPGSGIRVSPARRMRDLLEEIELADQVGLDVFGVGEHHRPDFVVSSPAVVLAAAAPRSRRWFDGRRRDLIFRHFTHKAPADVTGASSR